MGARMIKRKFFKRKDGLIAGILLFPILTLLLIFYVYPVFHNIWISMTNYSGLRLKNYGFVGLKNYRQILIDGVSGFTSMLVWTVVFAICVVILSFLLGLLIAVLLEKENVKLARIYRGIFILPWVIPSVVTLLLWRGFLDTTDGIVNQLLSIVGIPAIPWLTDPNMARISSILVMVWFSFPYFITVSQGILQSISATYYEAARIDGATAAQLFFNITIPFVVKAILPTLVMAFIMQFNQFGMYMLTAGGPAAEHLGDPGSTDLLITYVFNMAFNNYRYDLAAAYAVIIFIFVAIFSFFAMRTGKRIGQDS